MFTFVLLSVFVCIVIADIGLFVGSYGRPHKSTSGVEPPLGDVVFGRGLVLFG